MLQIHNEHTDIPDDAAIAVMAGAFEQHSFVRLAQLVDAPLRDAIMAMIDPDTFEERLTPAIGCVECCTDARIENGLQTMLNQAPVLETIGRIIGRPVHLWVGNTVRRVPGRNHFSSWHNDQSPPVVTADGTHYRRAVPLSLNLSTGRFSGGNLEMRYADSGQIFADIANPEPGDAILFRIDDNLQHRVADVTGTIARMVHVGWFHERVA